MARESSLRGTRTTCTRNALQLMATVVWLAALALLHPVWARACSCAQISREKRRPRVRGASIGTVVEKVETSDEPDTPMAPFPTQATATYELDVSETLKGHAKGRVRVVTGRDSATC